MTKGNLFGKTKILDCTLRDGGHLNKWNFSKDFASRVFSTVSELGLDYTEVGYVTKKGIFPSDTGLWRFSTEEDIRSIVSPGYHTKIAVMGDIGKVGLENFIDKDESIIDFVRLAFYPGHINDAIKLGEEVMDKGYEVSLNLMAIVKYSKEELKELVSLLSRSRIENAVVSDSFGSLFPNEVYSLVEMFKAGTGKKIGFHAHNNMELAFANTISAVSAGASVIDATVYGIGRGAGNVPLEVILSYINHHENGSINLVPLLELIEDEFIELKKELKWGYNLQYVLSGILQCHPTFASKLLKEYHFNLRESWPILTNISKRNPIEYDKGILESAISELGKEKRMQDEFGNIGSVKSEKINLSPPVYAGRHQGRDFLILAQGPSLKKYISSIKNFAKQNNLIVLGANYLEGLALPDYHAFCNIKRFSRYIDFANHKSKLLIGAYIPKKVIEYYTKRDYEIIPYVDDSTAKFDIKNGIIQTNCGTVSILLIAVAMIMGARKTYVVGLDGYKLIDGNAMHFYDEKEIEKKIGSNSVHNLCKKHLADIRDYQIKHGMEPFVIITPTSYTDFYAKMGGFE